MSDTGVLLHTVRYGSDAEAMRAALAVSAEVGSLRAELAKADGQINRCVEQNKYLESTISCLREYAGHKSGCARENWLFSDADFNGEQMPCDCGYDEIMRELEESK